MLSVQSASCVGIEGFMLYANFRYSPMIRIVSEVARSMLKKLPAVSLRNFVFLLPICCNGSFANEADLFNMRESYRTGVSILFLNS